MDGQRTPRNFGYRRLIRGGEGRLVDGLPRPGLCGLTGGKLATSDAHASLVAAIGVTFLGASWQRCRAHFAVSLMSITQKEWCP
ncbi:transposase [Rhodococcus sp. 5A-K4]|uniref:transposase n=1 Tax=Rhodococcus sp. 5A-K4 TaxID=3384442 RepID=UPI0038D4205C